MYLKWVHLRFLHEWLATSLKKGQNFGSINVAKVVNKSLITGKLIAQSSFRWVNNRKGSKIDQDKHAYDVHLVASRVDNGTWRSLIRLTYFSQLDFLQNQPQKKVINWKSRFHSKLRKKTNSFTGMMQSVRLSATTWMNWENCNFAELWLRERMKFATYLFSWESWATTCGSIRSHFEPAYP